MSGCGCRCLEDVPPITRCGGAVPTDTLRPEHCARGSVYPRAWAAYGGGVSTAAETYYPRRITLSLDAFESYYLYTTDTTGIMDSDVWESASTTRGDGSQFFWRLTALPSDTQPARLEKVYTYHVPSGGLSWVVTYRSMGVLGRWWPNMYFEHDPDVDPGADFARYLQPQLSGFGLPTAYPETCRPAINLNGPYNESVPAPGTYWNTAEVTMTTVYTWHDDGSDRGAGTTTYNGTCKARLAATAKYYGRGATPIWVPDGENAWFICGVTDDDGYSLDFRVASYCDFYAYPWNEGPVGGFGRLRITNVHSNDVEWFDNLPLTYSSPYSTFWVSGASRYAGRQHTFTINSMSYSSAP